MASRELERRFGVHRSGSPWSVRFLVLVLATSCACGARTGIEADVVVEGPKCSGGIGPGLTNCGAGSESCCTSLEVSGGSFYRTYSNSGSGPTGEADPASVSRFRLDKYPVTVGRFRRFAGAWSGGYVPPAGSGKHAHLNGGAGLANSAAPGTYEPGWVASDDAHVSPTDASLLGACDDLGGAYGTWTSSPGSNENLPITCITWQEAYAFCIWDGGFLPSYAERDYATAGGNLQREYPWGSTAPGTDNQFAVYGCYFANGAGTCTETVADIAPVGTATRGGGRWGQLDLAGELFEWNLDASGPLMDPCADCADLPVNPVDRVLSGSTFDGPLSFLTYPNGGGYPPTGRDIGNGFRCARAP